MDKKDIEQIIRKEIVTGVLNIQDFIIAGNWKMNHTKNEVVSFLNAINKYDFGTKNTLILFPPSPYLYLFEQKLRYSRVLYGVQNFYPEENGAFTGEISLRMAKDFGSKYALVGHSERRNIFKEDNQFASNKVKKALEYDMIPILCVGENLDQRKNEDYKSFIVKQIKDGFSQLNQNELSKVIIAYEPIWAIGTGETATPEQVEEIHTYIRSFLKETYGKENGMNIPILYGGSVKPQNIKELALADNVSGFLIGGASLDATSFIKMNEILK